MQGSGKPARNRPQIKSWSKRNDRHSHEGWDHGKNRSQVEIQLIYGSRDELLFEKEFHSIRETLPQPEEPNIGERYPHSVRSKPILDPGTKPTFGGHASRNHSQNNQCDGNRFHERKD